MGMSSRSSQSFVSTLQVSSLYSPEAKYDITAFVVPCVTCDLPLQPVCNYSSWSHLSMLPLADPDFALPGRIDLLLGADLYADVMLHGRRCGHPGHSNCNPNYFRMCPYWKDPRSLSLKESSIDCFSPYHCCV